MNLQPKNSASSDLEGAQKNGDGVLDNLEFFLTRLRALSCCESIALPAGGFCLSTGSGSASENWAFCRAAVRDEEPVRAALRFFEVRGLPFVWPLLGDGGAFLDRLGLREGGRLLAMSRGSDDPTDEREDRVAFAPVRDDEGACRWANAMLRGFGVESDAPESLIALARGMRSDGALRLVTARLEGQDAGTFLLALDPAAAGVYYFAVLPSFRRQGVATAMMAEILRLARDAGSARVVLQATPSGVPFYRSVGFESLGEIPLFSASDDVF